MPRYERDESWFTIEVDGTELVVRDVEGERVERFELEEDAEGAYDDRVFAALEAGYRLAAEPEPSDPRRALEQAILSAPDDLEAHLVYADLLMTEDDPRGELIAISAGLSSRPDDPDLRGRETRFLKEHADDFYGDFDDLIALGLQLEWKLGFIRTARLLVRERDWNEEDDSATTEEMAALLSSFLAHASTRFLRELQIRMRWHDIDDEGVLDPIVAAIATTDGPWDTLASLDLSPGHEDETRTQLGNGDLLFSNLPALHTLRIRCDELFLRDLGTARLPSAHEALRHLGLGGCVSPAVVRALSAARWPSLEELDLSLLRTTIQPGALAALFANPDRLPALTTLRLRRAAFTDELADLLLAAPRFAERLEVLDLSSGSMTNAGAEILIRGFDWFRRLKRLDLTANRMGGDVLFDLRKLSCEVAFEDQLAEGDDRFDEIQE